MRFLLLKYFVEFLYFNVFLSQRSMKRFFSTKQIIFLGILIECLMYFLKIQNILIVMLSSFHVCFFLIQTSHPIKHQKEIEKTFKRKSNESKNQRVFNFILIRPSIKTISQFPKQFMIRFSVAELERDRDREIDA